MSQYKFHIIRVNFFRVSFKSLKYDCIMMGILFLTAWKLTCALEYFVDIELYDESAYLDRGINLLNYGMPRSDFGPLYSVWYFFLSRFQTDKIQLYYLNIKVLAALLPLFFYVFLRRVYIPIREAGMLAWFFLICNANLPVCPKISHLTISIALLSFIITTYIKSLATSILVLSIGALIGSYARLEYFLASLCFGGGYLLLITTKKERISKQLPALVVALLISVGLLKSMGLPAMLDKKEIRSYWTFSGYFSVNWTIWNKSDITPLTNYIEISRNYFGDAQSISDAFINNPSFFIKHVCSNIQRLGNTLLTLLTPVNYRQILFPNNYFYKRLELLLLCSVVGLYIYSLRANWSSRIKLKEKFEQFKGLLLLLFIYSIPGWLAAIVMFPVAHYLILQVMLLLIGIAVFVFADLKRSRVITTGELLIIGLFLLAFTPTPEDTYRASIYLSPGRYSVNRKTIDALKALNIHAQVNLLETAGGYDIYLGDNYQRIAEYDKKTSFSEFMQTNQINMIVLSEALNNDTRFRDDEQWKSFLENYEHFDYTKLPVDGTPQELLIKKDLLRKRGESY